MFKKYYIKFTDRNNGIKIIAYKNKDIPLIILSNNLIVIIK